MKKSFSITDSRTTFQGKKEWIKASFLLEKNIQNLCPFWILFLRSFVKIINIYKLYMEAKKEKEKYLVSDMHTNIGIVLKFFYYMKPI